MSGSDPGGPDGVGAVATSGFDPVALFTLHRGWHAVAVGAALAAAATGLGGACRASEPRRRAAGLALAALTGLQAAGLVLERRRRRAQLSSTRDAARG